MKYYIILLSMCFITSGIGAMEKATELMDVESELMYITKYDSLCLIASLPEESWKDYSYESSLIAEVVQNGHTNFEFGLDPVVEHNIKSLQKSTPEGYQQLVYEVLQEIKQPKQKEALRDIMSLMLKLCNKEKSLKITSLLQWKNKQRTIKIELLVYL